MSFFRVLLFVSLALFNFTAATSRPIAIARPPLETGSVHRRGVPYNEVKYIKYFDVGGSRVTWAYNWDSRSHGDIDAWFEFVPMLHSNRADQTGKWAEDVRAAAFANKDAPTHLLGFNEPDNCEPGMGGACMDLGSSIAAWKQHMEPQKSLKEKMYLGSPAVTNGPNGLAYLSSFINACTGCSIDFINIHWYDEASNAAYFKKHVEDTRKVAAGRPIWITEFKPRGNDEQIEAFLDEVLPWLDTSSDVHRYAYFMATTGDGFLIDNGGNSLSNVGSRYAFGA
ncbi:uncharacterized protein EKO05_0003966 [Ascochyta rabiei]|uniref:Carbohydrate metabolic process n=1 Tax=Didymella rabiei TaxID=5454 RepID=A0A163DZJ1_DIDRA|nr:uncharacterized protein EKO05_0003966 [Ascochyta rabiei]KZM23430.1 carbohydrate metabolic process [Ascochyta rabiei]UPX13459.1 hypothetical protein EKO05_0003966 [Ascochyta rabiei]